MEILFSDMKRNIRQLLLLAFFALLNATASAQTAFDGKLRISEQRFERTGSFMRVHMRVTYPDKAIGSSDTWVITPILQNGNNSVSLPAATIYGKRLQKDMQRQATIEHTQLNATPTYPLVGAYGKKYHFYTVEESIPFEDWMRLSSLLFSVEINNGNKTKSQSDKALVFINFQDLSGLDTSEDYSRAQEVTIVNPDMPTTTGLDQSVRIQKPIVTTPITVSGGKMEEIPIDWVQFMGPVNEPTRDILIEGTIPLNDRRRINNMTPDNFNKAIFNEIADEIKKAQRIPQTQLKAINITGYGAPIGNYKRNEINAMRRSLELKEFLMNKPETMNDNMNISWIAEDWDSIYVLIANSNVRLRQAMMDIIRSEDVVNGRENDLRIISNGEPYSYLQKNVFPKVERVKYQLVFSHRLAASAYTGIFQAHNDTTQMRFADLYTVATSFPRGSREFNDILDLTARLFPDNAEANIDAAGVALLRKDPAKAQRYLSNWMTDERAYNNIGLMYLMQGNLQKADVYLQMAESAGVPEAIRALDSLHRRR